MIIHQPTITKSSGEVTLSASVELNASAKGLPDRLWFRYPEQYEYGVADQVDGFLASLILSAMYFGEDLSVRGTVSPLLAYQIPKLVRTYTENYPEIFYAVDVKFEKIKPVSFDKNPDGMGLAYSGGIDSTYTLFSHTIQNQPLKDFHLTHGVFVHGFDILLRQPEYYQLALSHARTVFDNLGIALIPVTTNCYSFHQFRMDWGVAFMPPLIGVGLTLQKIFKRFYVSSGRSIHDKGDITSLINEFESTANLGSDTCTIVLHDNTISRDEKINAIKDWSITHTSLRVCTSLVKPSNGLNCGRCPKCIITMTLLELMGSLKEYTTFTTPYSALLIVRLAFVSRDGFLRAKSIMRLALQRKRYDIFLVIFLMYIPGMIKMRLYFTYIHLLGYVPDSIKYNLKQRRFPHNE